MHETTCEDLKTDLTAMVKPTECRHVLCCSPSVNLCQSLSALFNTVNKYQWKSTPLGQRWHKRYRVSFFWFDKSRKTFCIIPPTNCFTSFSVSNKMYWGVIYIYQLKYCHVNPCEIELWNMATIKYGQSTAGCTDMHLLKTKIHIFVTMKWQFRTFYRY